MRDRDDGGWFGRVDRSGKPLLAGTKHAHATAYLISCGVEAHLLTGDREPLDIAREAFEWLEATLHGAEHGRYHGWATRGGRVILGRADLPAELATRQNEPLGHGIGLKDASQKLLSPIRYRPSNAATTACTMGARKPRRW